ncbi:uncharacterized protein [Argopecten irradians]|uniref:uncharacterized protein n=1 Tax=Argopecten irradians TaxID=31199 RepID=UPI003714713C
MVRPCIRGIEHDLAVHAQSNNNGPHIITSRGTRKLEPAGKIKGHRWLTVLCLCLMITTSCTDDRELEQIEIARPPIKISWTNSQYSICRCQQCCKKVENHMKPVNRENTPLDKRRPLMDQEHSSSTEEFYLIVVEEREVKSIAETETVSWHKKIYTYTIKGFMPVLYFFMKSLTSEMRRNQFKNPKISTSTGVAEAGPHRPNWIYILLFCHVFIPAGLYYGFQKEVAHLRDSRSIELVGNPANRNGKTDNLVQHASSHLAREETPSSKLQKETDSFAEYVQQSGTELLTRNNPTVSKRITETKPSDITNAIPLESCESLALIERPVDRNSSTANETQDGDHPERNIQGKQEGNVFPQRNNAKNDARCGTEEDRLKSSERTEDKHDHELYKTNKNRPTYEHRNASSEKRNAAENNQTFASNKYMETSCHTGSTFDTFETNGTQHIEENNDNGNIEKPSRNDCTGNTGERNDKTKYHLKNYGNGNAEDPEVNTTKLPVDHARTSDTKHLKKLLETNEIRNTEETLPINTASNAQEHSETYADKYSADHLESIETENTRSYIMKATTSEVCCQTEKIVNPASFRETAETKELPSALDAITNSLKRTINSSERTRNEHLHEFLKTNKNRPTFEHCNASEKRSAAEDNQMISSNKYMEDSCHTRITFDTFGKNGTQHTEEKNDNGSLERPPRNDSTGNIDENDITEYARTNDNNRIKNTNETKNTEEIFTTNAASNAQEHSETYADKYSADHLEPDETAIGNTKEISSASDAITCSLEPLGTAKTKSTAEQEQTKQHSNTFNSVNMEKPFRAANNITEKCINRIDNRNNEIFDTQHKVEEISHSSDVAECTDVATRPDDGIYGFNRNGIALDDNVERITIKTSSNTVRKGNYQGYSPCFDNQQTIENQYHDENESEGDDDDDDEDDETMLKTQNTTFPSEGDDHLATAFIYQDDDEHLESVSLVEDGCSRDDADIIFNSSTSSTLNSPPSNQTPKEHNICKEPKNSNGPYVSCCFESDEYIPGKVNKMMPEISSGFVSYTNDHLTTATSASANLKVFKGHEISVRLAVSRALKKVITPNNASQFRNRFRRLSPHAQHLDNIRRIREATFITQNLSNLWQQSTALPGQQHYRDENRTFNRSPRLQMISDERETLGAVGVNGGSALPASTDTKASLDVFAAIGVCSVTESMVYEWGRLKTFFNFPMNNPMMPVTLAKYGFYYNGDSDVVKCFSCNVSHGNWQKGDSVYVVHYQTSPRCRFMNGEDKRNVPVNGDVAASVDKRAGGRDDSLARNTDLSETTPRLSTPATVTSLFLDPKSNITPETDTRGSSGPSSNEETREVDNQYMSQQHPTTLDQRQQLRLEQNGGGQQPLQRQQDQTVVNGAATNFTNTEAAAARPRYPNYSSAAARAGTFNGFPNHLDQTPQFMAKAGFFYAGYGDYVRCFFCGGGLRNWEPGDDPWVEHARWFPRCTHVKQHKGQPFINLVLQRQRELTLPNEYITTRQHASNTDQNVTNQTASVQTHNDRQTGARNSHTSARNQTESKSEPNTTANTQQSRVPGSLVDRDQSAKQSPDPKQTGSNGRKRPSAGTANSSKITNETKNVEHKTSNSQTAQHLNPEPKLRGSSQANSYTDEELKSIQEENTQLKEQMKCKICMDNDVCISFLPCGHLCCCAECAPVMVKCPICRQVISGSMITYLS